MKKAFITFSFILLGALLPAMTVCAEPENDTESEGSTQQGITVVSDDPVENIDYTGPVDLITGEPIEEGVTYNSEFVTISDNVRYRKYGGEYVYQVGNTMLRSSVADGMIVTEPVSMSKEGKTNLTLYKDGEALDDIPEMVKDKGEYVMVTTESGGEKQLFSFKIVGEVTGKITYYILPAGFSVRNLTYNSKPVNHNQGSVDMTKEGHYIVDYTCAATGKDYSLDVFIDHTPPQVTFLGLDEDDTCRGPVTVQGMEETDTISIMFDETEEVTLDEENKLYDTGYYHVMITDQAGNSTEKDFEILLYININAALFILAIFAGILGVIIALAVSRKKLRVR